MVRINKTDLVYTTTKTNDSSTVQKDKNPNSIMQCAFNGEIEDTRQGSAGDCWLLTNLNCLRDTKWGKKLIKDAIKPDGNGGVTITFNGAKTQVKEFHITVDDIIKAKESGIYSEGDDDVIVMELAVEKYLKMCRNQENKNPGEAISGEGFDTSEFIELLSGKKPNHYYSMPQKNNTMEEISRSRKERLRILSEIEKHPGEYAVQISFIGNSVDGLMVAEHAYQLQKVITENDKQYVVLVNPWNSSEKIKMEVDKFIPYVDLIDIADQPGAKPNNNLKSDISRKNDFIKLQLEVYNEIGKSRDIKDINLDKVKDFLELVDEDNIKDLFSNKDAIYLFVSVCDKLKYGWGNGKDKKALIAPMVDSYCEYAKKQNVPEEIIQEVKSSCYKELDALLYTNESTIIEKLQMLFDEIEKSKKNNSFGSFGFDLKNLHFNKE